MSRRMIGRSALVVVMSSALYSTAAAQAPLLPHRAVYAVELAETSERSGIENMSGRMVYEFTGSSCEGYSTDFRFVTTIEGAEATQLSDQQTKTHEDVLAKTFRFNTKSFTDEKLDKELTGSAEVKGEDVSVSLTSPEAKDLSLGSAQFPVRQMLSLIERAKKGERMFEARLYDGSENGDETVLVSTLVGKNQKAAADDPEVKLLGKYSAERFWPVSTSYFKIGSKTDSVPDYQMAFKFYENGITRDLTLSYVDFSLKGKLVQFDLLPAKPCKDTKKAN